MSDHRAHIQDEFLGVVPDVYGQDFLLKLPISSIVPTLSTVPVVSDELWAKFNIWWNPVHSWFLFYTLIVVKTKGQEWLPCVLKSLAHRALNAIVVITNHLLHVKGVVVHLVFCGLVLLQTIDVECMAALLKGHSNLILLIDHILQL